MPQGCGNAALSCFPQSFREVVENHTAQRYPQPGRPRRHTGRLCSCHVSGFLSGKGSLGDCCFLLCILAVGGISACRARIKTPARPFGESRTLACVGAERLWATAAFPCRRCSAYREVRRSAGGGGGFPPPGFLGTLSPQKEFPWGSGGRSAPVKGGVGESPTKRQAGQRPARERRRSRLPAKDKKGRP